MSVLDTHQFFTGRYSHVTRCVIHGYTFLEKAYIRYHDWFSLFFHCLLVFIIYSLYMKVRIQKMIEKSIRMEYFEIG